MPESILEKGVTSLGMTHRGYEHYGERHWKSTVKEAGDAKSHNMAHSVGSSRKAGSSSGVSESTKRTKVY